MYTGSDLQSLLSVRECAKSTPPCTSFSYHVFQVKLLPDDKNGHAALVQMENQAQVWRVNHSDGDKLCVCSYVALQATNAVKFLNNAPLFGRKLIVAPSHHENIADTPILVFTTVRWMVH